MPFACLQAIVVSHHTSSFIISTSLFFRLNLLQMKQRSNPSMCHLRDRYAGPMEVGYPGWIHACLILLASFVRLSLTMCLHIMASEESGKALLWHEFSNGLFA